MKTCPYCAEKIQDEATVCRYCKRELPIAAVVEKAPEAAVDVDQQAVDEEESKPRKRSIGLLIWLIILSLNFIAVVCILISGVQVDYERALGTPWAWNTTQIVTTVVILFLMFGVYLGSLIPSWILWSRKRTKLAIWLSLIPILPSILTPFCYIMSIVAPGG